jgi:hypothetical protein
MRHGVVTRLSTAYVAGLVAEAVSRGVLASPLVMQTHGGRARTIESGDLHIDVAFVAAPAADRHGNVPPRRQPIRGRVPAGTPLSRNPAIADRSGMTQVGRHFAPPRRIALDFLNDERPALRKGHSGQFRRSQGPNVKKRDVLI